MKGFILVIAFIVAGCSMDNTSRRDKSGSVGIFPERSQVGPDKDRAREKEMRREIMSGDSPTW